jgi:2-polyprenyl-3-methyl-5-hydroxy-6-metoxy-1,4-benzoquinol methylase
MPARAELEEASCLFCPPGTPVTKRFDDPPFAVVECSRCGLVFVSPRVAADRLAEVYGERYWHSPEAKEYGYADYRAEAANWRRTYARRARVLDGKLKPGARVLDVGCAAGYFGALMRERGYDVWGLELSAPMVAEARGRLGADRVHHGTLADAPYEPSSFDLITFWDVVEHLPDPVGALRQARRLLNPEQGASTAARPGYASHGLLLIETQNVESRFARLMGRRWQHFKQVEHLWHFSPATAGRLLDAAGFAPVSLTARRAGKHVGWDFVAERAGRVHPVLSKALAPLSRLPGAPYVNLFDEMIVLARPGAG